MLSLVAASPSEDSMGWRMGWDGMGWMTPPQRWGSIAACPCCPLVLPWFTDGAVSLQAAGMLCKVGWTQELPCTHGCPCPAVCVSGVFQR